MIDRKTNQHDRLFTIIKKLVIIFLVIAVSLLCVGLIVMYAWPLRNSSLQTSKAELTYQHALDRIATINQQESAEGVRDECRSKLYAHNAKTTKVVVMFHGVTACPKQFSGLAQKFYDSGYNVYIPRTPHHGLADGRKHGKVTAQELVEYATASITIASGLGDERGVIGLSGGGMLATWAAEYRDEIKHLLVLSPFYEPASAKAPKWRLPFFYVLYGQHLLPDRFVEPATLNDAAFSYSGLANYGIVMKNLNPDAKAPV